MNVALHSDKMSVAVSDMILVTTLAHTAVRVLMFIPFFLRIRILFSFLLVVFYMFEFVLRICMYVTSTCFFDLLICKTDD